MGVVQPVPGSAAMVPMVVAESVGDAVNFLIDSVVATLERLLELPLFGVLLCVGVLALGLLWLIARLARHPERVRLAAGLRFGLVVLLVAAVLFVVDRRVAGVQERLGRLRQQASQSTLALLDAITRSGVQRPPLVDVVAAQAALAPHFPGLRLQRVACDAATDLVHVNIEQPLVDAWLAVVDLRHEGLELAIDGQFDDKTFTSDFALAHGCTVAINGEAGNSPRPRCGLGPWRGNLVVRGETLLQELPGQPLPFLAFDRLNRARFVASTASERTLPADAWNVIWGRLDGIVDGVAADGEWRLNQPRTVMGIDRDGTRLFLLVVDGRQMQRSWGFTLRETTQFLRGFDVHGAMLCDQGGSTCLWAAAFGGIVNVPSDDDGVERPTYTHFGVVLRERAATDGR